MRQRYIALLRGVMPTGKNKVPMAKLRDVLERSGLSNVTTYIQSGNVILESDLAPSDIEVLIHDEIIKNIGADIAVIVMSRSELQKIISNNPIGTQDTNNKYYIFLNKNPEEHNLIVLSKEELKPTQWVPGNKVIYMHCPQTYSKSKMNNNFVERKLKVTATTRNHNTVTKLAELCA